MLWIDIDHKPKKHNNFIRDGSVELLKLWINLWLKTNILEMCLKKTCRTCFFMRIKYAHLYPINHALPWITDKFEYASSTYFPFCLHRKQLQLFGK